MHAWVYMLCKECVTFDYLIITYSINGKSFWMSTSRTPDNQMLITRSSPIYTNLYPDIYGKHCVHMLLQHMRVVFFFISELFDVHRISNLCIQFVDKALIEFLLILWSALSLARRYDTHLNAWNSDKPIKYYAIPIPCRFYCYKTVSPDGWIFRFVVFTDILLSNNGLIWKYCL